MGVGARPRARSGAEKLRIAGFGLLVTLSPYSIDPLSCTVALLQVKSPFGSLKIAELYRNFFDRQSSWSKWKREKC